MAVMIRLTVPQAMFLGATGCACLGASYVLTQTSQYVDKLRRQIESMENATASEASIRGRITSALSVHMRRFVASVLHVVELLFSCLSFLLCCAGAGFITYAAVGPLLI